MFFFFLSSVIGASERQGSMRLAEKWEGSDYTSVVKRDIMKIECVIVKSGIINDTIKFRSLGENKSTFEKGISK